MARGKQTRSAKAAPNVAMRGGRGRGKRRNAPDTEVPDVYQAMLAENDQSTASGSGTRRLPKRRRIEQSSATAVDSLLDEELDEELDEDLEVVETTKPAENAGTDSESDSGSLFQADAPKLQTIVDDSEDSEDSDMEWEEVGIGSGALPATEDIGSAPDDGNLEIVLDSGRKSADKGKTARRKGVTASERRTRLDIHKMHLLCLLIHVHIRNHWCNDHKVQAILRRLLTPPLVKQLSPKANLSQFQRHEYFMAGLKDINTKWKESFRVTATGSTRPHWRGDVDSLKDVRQFQFLFFFQISPFQVKFRLMIDVVQTSIEL